MPFPSIVESHPYLFALLLIYLCTPLLAYVIFPLVLHARRTRKPSHRHHHSPHHHQLYIPGPDVIVCVLGDLGHSPRMCYHARSLAARGYHVDLLGYLEELPPMDLVDHPAVTIQEIGVVKNTMGLPYLIFGVLKAARQTVALFQTLCSLKHAQSIILQNPPSLPMLLVTIIYKYTVRKGDFSIVLDWHNLNYTILGLKYGSETHPVVRGMRLYERVCSQYADLHLTVTKSLARFLVAEFGVSSEQTLVLYDRPAEQFRPLNAAPPGTSNFARLQARFPALFSSVSFPQDPQIIVTSTSFTPDEDLGLLLRALSTYADIATAPPLLVLVTGKGPLKAHFMKQAETLLPALRVQFKFLWLLAADYPVLLAHAHIGVSLHTLSLGLDLPMKVLDFFGCGVPVIALGFAAVDELVHEGQNGRIVGDSDSMAEALRVCFAGELEPLRQGALEESHHRWAENWEGVLGGVYEDIT